MIYSIKSKTKVKALITFAIGSDTHFKKLCLELGLDSLLQQESFNTNRNRVKNRTLLADYLSEKVQLLDSKVLLKKLQALNVPAGKIKSLDEVFEEPSAQELIRTETIAHVNTKRVTSVVFK